MKVRNNYKKFVIDKMEYDTIHYEELENSKFNLEKKIHGEINTLPPQSSENI